MWRSRRRSRTTCCSRSSAPRRMGTANAASTPRLTMKATTYQALIRNDNVRSGRARPARSSLVVAVSKDIPGSPYGVDELDLEVAVDLGPEPADEHVDDV